MRNAAPVPSALPAPTPAAAQGGAGTPVECTPYHQQQPEQAQQHQQLQQQQQQQQPTDTFCLPHSCEPPNKTTATPTAVTGSGLAGAAAGAAPHSVHTSAAAAAAGRDVASYAAAAPSAAAKDGEHAGKWLTWKCVWGEEGCCVYNRALETGGELCLEERFS